MSSQSPIVITGAGIVSAIGIGQSATLSALLQQQTGVGNVRYLVTSHHELPVGEVKLSNAEMQQQVAVEADGGEALSRTTLMARLALREALAQAGMLGHDQQLAPAFNGTMPLLSGTTVGGMDRGETLVADTSHEAMMQQLVAADTDCGSNTRQIARGFGQWALLDTLSTACSSAANAIALGANLLRTGRYERVVVGGTESLSRFHLNGFNTLMILDAALCRPFDATRAGLNLGEGAAYLVLETLEAARQHEARPLAILSGWGNACDAYHQTASSPEGEGAFRAMRQAIGKAGLTPADIDYVNAHGTATPNNDPSELAAMHRVWGTAALPPYSSTKAFTGHTTSASGSIEAVICLLALQHQFLPVSLGCQTPIEGEPAPVCASTSLPTGGLRHVLCNAFGFGGNDSSLVLSHVDTGTFDEAVAPHMDTGTIGEVAPKRRYRIVAHRTLTAADPDPDFRQYIPAAEARRLGPMLRRTLAVAIQTLRDAGSITADGQSEPFVPDAIVTGTAWGNSDSTETFLRDLLTGGEQLLKPTPFMQSTHNTLGSLIAIHTHNHGYNNTHSQGADSLRMALLDAEMLIELGEADSVLVGLHDAVPERRHEALLLVAE